MTRDTVLLDVDGTLIDSTYHCAIAWAQAFESFGMKPPLWHIHRAIGMGGDQLVPHVTDQSVEEEHGDALREAWEDAYRPMMDDVRAFDGVRELVDLLHARGVKVALATSSNSEFAQKALETIGMAAEDFESMTTSSDADASKPEPDILASALEKAGGSRALLVGDSTWDIEAAKRMGAPCVAVRTGGFGVDELTEAGAVLVVDAVGDLLDADWDGLLESEPR
ncbi:HAD family hydrolase [Actinomyces haliotis]|uniref:HAD family hydrolase n=1 Tax=Actinomyces haliotis TaxID=1280843 RepID=UPI00188DF7E3|nr:HAD family hydrolase [Actinomyces haliotis]